MNFLKKPKTVENLQRLENAQKHVSANKEVYIAAGGGLLAGVVLTRIFMRVPSNATVNITVLSK